MECLHLADNEMKTMEGGQLQGSLRRKPSNTWICPQAWRAPNLRTPGSREGWVSQDTGCLITSLQFKGMDTCRHTHSHVPSAQSQRSSLGLGARLVRCWRGATCSQGAGTSRAPGDGASTRTGSRDICSSLQPTPQCCSQHRNHCPGQGIRRTPFLEREQVWDWLDLPPGKPLALLTPDKWVLQREASGTQAWSFMVWNRPYLLSPLLGVRSA